VIRRLFWLLAGAVLGVTGYRRAGRLARSLRPASAIRPAGRVLRAVAWPGHGATARPGSRTAPGRGAAFLADVRDGMEIYLDQHARQPDHGAGPAGPDPGGRHLARFRFDNAKDGR
jgi:hypothetical protein